MSEKLINCRKELSDAIDRALDGSLCPMSSHLQIGQSSLHHIIGESGPAECHYHPPGSPALLHQPLESIRLIPTVGEFADTVCTQHPGIRKPLSNLENVLHLRKVPSPEQRSEELQWSLQNTENLPRDLSPQDVTRDLLAIIEDTSSPVMQEISRTLELDPDRNRDSSFSISEEDLPLALDDRKSPAGGAAEPVPDDDQVVDMVLDLEDDYSHLKSFILYTVM